MHWNAAYLVVIITKKIHHSSSSQAISYNRFQIKKRGLNKDFCYGSVHLINKYFQQARVCIIFFKIATLQASEVPCHVQNASRGICFEPSHHH